MESVKNNMKPGGKRIATIDVLRGLTMTLMIIVNDLWTLKGVPDWLGHAPWGHDGIGVADVIFPLFLFLVGMSLPYAMEARRKKGDNTLQLLWHIATRSFALIVMGLFLVNGETYNAAATGMHRYFWNPLCCIAFILVWNTYPGLSSKILIRSLQGLGVLGLLVLGWIYRGGPDDDLQRMTPQWWGILGQIGWAYLVCGVVMIFSRGNITAVLASWLLFAAVSILFHMKMIPEALLWLPRPISAGTLTAITLGGLLTSVIFKQLNERSENGRIFGVLLGLTLFWYGLYLLTRPFWGLAKLGATPAWLFFCCALAALAFMILYWLVELKQKESWFVIVKPAGSYTLLCYLVPYLMYGLQRAVGFSWPEYLSIGWVGLAKSAFFALICVWITSLLARIGIRLKV